MHGKPFDQKIMYLSLLETMPLTIDTYEYTQRSRINHSKPIPLQSTTKSVYYTIFECQPCHMSSYKTCKIVAYLIMSFKLS